jgi:hypothetical protein
MTFDDFINDLQDQFIFDIRAEPTLMEKLRRLWIKNNPQDVESNEQQ